MRSIYLAICFVVGCLAEDNIFLCRDSICSDCPTTINAGTGWPECSLYEAYDFSDSNFPVESDGTMDFYLEIPAPNSGCKFLVGHFPESTIEGCGEPVIVVENAQCALFQTRGKFSTQFCCGKTDCEIAEGDWGVQAHNTSITIPSPDSPQHSKAESTGQSLDGRSWKGRVDPGFAKRGCDFTQEGDYYESYGTTQQISQYITGPATITDRTTQTVSWTTTFSASISYGILSAGIDFETSKSMSKSWTYTFEVPAGQTGVIIWTPTMTCRHGYVTGCSTDETGDACFPKEAEDGTIEGNLALQIHS
ncbi:hypothetical protein UCRPC4_g01011 [Phaeomoniella chlamydospora]|uniref:Uncharacterized protein n=1 Tax=Phaeomoniella chlamydospora TaxID=158046 RepID=A0A0G2EZM0_PHACM|nr:hypothetical protein UCRPC4_g01011 [Phaeomoniella chlamydospora]